MQKLKRKILVVDDDLSILRICEKRLQANGYDVVLADGGRKGIKSALEHKPDLILLDIMMTDLTGAEVAVHLNKNELTKNIPIIFITATISKKQDKIEKEIELEGRLYPAFAKPLYTPKLLSVIRKSINKNENL